MPKMKRRSELKMGGAQQSAWQLGKGFIRDRRKRGLGDGVNMFYCGKERPKEDLEDSCRTEK